MTAERHYPSGSPEPTPIAIDRGRAAMLLGMSVDSFERYVQPEIPVIRRGRLRLFLIKDLREWAERNAQSVNDG